MTRRGLAVAVFAWIGFASSGVYAADPAPAGSPTLHPRLRVETSLGGFVVELDAEKAPITVLNFIDYVEAKYYDGTIFHRVVSRSVIQGGAFLPDMTEKKEGLRAAIQCESYNGLLNARGTIAMYRLPGEPHTARAQFFINHHDNASLDKLRDGEGYAVFGRVVEGMEVVEKIRDTPVAAHPKYAAGKNPVVPVTPVVIQSIRMVSLLDRPAAESLAKAAQLTQDLRLESLVRRFEAQAGTKAIVSASGLRSIDFVVGRGAFPLEGEAVEINYRGTLMNGKEFDSSLHQADGPVTINVSNLIPGLREGLLGMQEGGKRVVLMPADLAYGPDGIPGRVPPGASLAYEVELLAVRPAVETPNLQFIEGNP